jgi:hypothetical protein
MKKLLFLLLLITSCGSDKIYKKQLKDDEIAIDWYHYSYISSGSPNYVVVTKGDKEELVFEYGYGLQDIELHKDTITILHLKFQTKPKVKNEKIFGYCIKYKEVTIDEMYDKFDNEGNPKIKK